MTKAIRLTVPVVGDSSIKEITPGPDDMGLCETSDALLYGFHGGANSKGPFLNAAYNLADKNGEISKGHKIFYLVDIEYSAPKEFDDKILYGQLQPDMLEQVPFLMVKRISTDCTLQLGEMWFEWAKATYGQKKALNADVDWTDEMSFIPAFPSLAENLFPRFPNLRSVVMPMHTKAGATSSLCWVGVSLKAKAPDWVSLAEVRMKPDIRVNLKFDGEG